ncbi:DDE transposase, partial [Candidatus Entotheonella serta]
SKHFVHAAGADTLRPTLLPHLYASILAHACNFGLEQMSQSTDYHHKLPFSQVWGSGILSSSDGQRFPVAGKNRHARLFPPTLGYGQGLTFYSWTSDQLSQYGSKPVIITARDATYVLDVILGNETELPILEHATDTAGATEMIFALFDLLGLRFTPRLRDIGSRRLYRSGSIDLQNYPRLQPHIKGRINRQRVLDWWDEMLRAAGSMKLRGYLMIANKGQLRRKRGEELVNQASCLNLVTNAVVLWNTVYMAEAVEQLKQEGYPVNESDLAHIWPTRYEHINVYGRYHFNVEEARG